MCRLRLRGWPGGIFVEGMVEFMLLWKEMAGFRSIVLKELELKSEVR